MTQPNIGIKLSVTGDAQVQSALGNVERGLANVGAAARAALAPMVLVTAAFEAAGKLVSVQREFDILNSSLKTVTGSSAAAAKEMEWIKAFAKETPFGLAQATQGFVKMKALGLDPSKAALTSFGNTAAAMGKDLNQMIEAVADASTGEFERLKEFGIKAKKEGDQVALTFQGVTKTIGNNAAEITGYLEAIGNHQFAGAMAERAQTLDGAIASLGDTWDELFRTISAQNTGSLMHDAVRMAEAAVTDLTTIIVALNGATGANAAQTGAMATVQEGLAIAFEAVAVLGTNVKYTLVQVGNELGGLAAQAAAVATGQFAQARQISALMRADAEKARAEVDATTARILSARSVAALGQPNTYDEPVTIRARAAAEAAAAAAKAAAAKAAADAAAKEAAAKKAAEQAAKDAKKAAEAELDWRRKTTLDYIKQWDDQAEAAQKAYDAARMGALKLASAAEDAQSTATAQLADKLAAMRDEIDAIGLTTAQVAELNATKAEQIIADKEIQLIMLQNADASAAQIQLLEQEINLRRQLVAAMRTKAGKEAAADAATEAQKAADEAAKAWQKASDDIEKSLTDALMRGFESGKDLAQVFRDTVANLFQTLVLRPVVQAIVSPVAAATAGTIGLPGTASAATSAASALGGFGGTLGALGTGLGAGAGMIAGGGISGWLSASTSLIGTGTAAGAAAGLGALAGPIGAVLAVASLIKSLDDSGTAHTGGLGAYSALAGRTMGDAVKGQGLGFDLASKDYTASSQTAAANMAQAVVGLLDSTAATFGQKAGYYAATAFADDTSKDGAWGALMLKLGDQVLLDWKNGADKWPGREFADGEAGAKAYAAAVAADVRDHLITQTPAWADDMLRALGDSPTLDQLGQVVQQLGAANAALQAMGRASQAFAAISDDATTALMRQLGGADGAVANLDSYYSAYYTQAQRSAITTQQLTEQLASMGLQLPATRDAWRDLVDAALASGDGGTAAALIRLSGAFATVTQSADDLAAAAQKAAEAAAEAAAKATTAARDAALKQLEYSAQRERTLLQQQASAATTLRDEVQSVFDALATAVRELQAEALGPTLTAAQGSSTIAAALAAARATGSLPEGGQLANAIAAARGGLGMQGYASVADQQFAQLVLAGQLQELQSYAGDQLTTAERQLRTANDQLATLDKTLAYWQDLLGLQTSGIDATMGVAQAVDHLRLLMFPTSGNTTATTGKPGSAQPGFGGGGSAGTGGPADSLSRLGNTYYGALGTAITDAGYIDRFDSINTYVNTLDFSASGAAASVAALTAAAQQYGVSAREIAIATGYNQADIEALLPNVPRYQVGTNYVPADGLAYLHRGEAVVPAAYNPGAGTAYQPATKADPALIAEMQALRAQVAELTRHARRTADATNGNPEVPMLVEIAA